MSSIPKYYWDACIWIELIVQSNAENTDRCKYVVELARTGKAQIWTSVFTLAEVYKRKCYKTNKSIPEEKDDVFDDFIEQEFVRKIQVDLDVARVARRLLRTYKKLRKPQDAVHVASCLLYNIDAMHTFDGNDLLHLDGLLPLKDKSGHLKICIPPLRTQPSPEPPKDPGQTDLFIQA